MLHQSQLPDIGSNTSKVVISMSTTKKNAIVSQKGSKIKVLHLKNCLQHWMLINLPLENAYMRWEWFRRNSVLDRIITGEEWIHYDNPQTSLDEIKLCICYETINFQRYRLQLMRLKQAIQEKLPEWRDRNGKLILQHDNARPHLGQPVRRYLEGVKWEVLPHPPYSPDIVPSDYHSFRSMQSKVVASDGKYFE
ncbi:hypothetical protein Trydic_g5594 [Trypoxylus dichotomus]